MRAYPLYPERCSESLDGAWDFCWLGDVPFDDLQPGAFCYAGLMAVPGVFDTCPEYFGKRGVGVYRRRLSWATAAGERLRLCLGGLGLCGRVWWDGERIGDCDLPYSSVQLDFTSAAGASHELVIAVDNRFDAVRSPLFLPNFDFYAYGGIYRSVELQRLPSIRLERVQLTTLDRTTGLVRLRLCFGGEVPAEVTATVAFDQGATEIVRLAVANGEAVLERLVPEFRLWSPASPALHTVAVSISGDSIVERFGIRTVETRGRDILLNGAPIRLLGLNRHESHPEFGPVQPAHLMADDLRLLRDLGCNFVRCVHYPQDQAFLDLCDQAGLLVWQESLGWNHREEDAKKPRFVALQEAQTRLMVRNSINHPAVILWGFLNECCSDCEAGKALYRSLAQIIRAEDPALLVTFASNRKERDLCFEFADVAAINIYPGWFEGVKDWNRPSSAWIADTVSRYAEVAERPDLKDKPLLISEIGCCALYGCHDRAHAQWSEEYQAEYFAEACRCVLGNPRYAGLALWQMFDTRSYVNAGTDVRGKPRGFNCAGVLDEYRRPKLAYDAVRAAFRAEASRFNAPR